MPEVIPRISETSEAVELSALTSQTITTIDAAVNYYTQQRDPNAYRTVLTFLVNAADRIRTGRVKIKDIFPDATPENSQDMEYVVQKVWAYEASLMAGG